MNTTVRRYRHLSYRCRQNIPLLPERQIDFRQHRQKVRILDDVSAEEVFEMFRSKLGSVAD